MKITYIKVTNYRNLCGNEIFLSDDINYFIGENDLGKSNLLDLFDVIFNKRRFKIEDYFEKEDPIEITISLKLHDFEIGSFEDYFDPDENNKINIIVKQDAPFDFIKYYHKESGEEISYTKFRALNFIKYDSLRTPKDELTFFKNKGVGKFLVFLMDKYVNSESIDTSDDYINGENLRSIVDYINQQLEKIKVFKDYDIKTRVEDNITELLYRMISIRDSKGYEIQKIGYGVQFTVIIILSILEKLMYLKESKGRVNYIFENDGKKCISMVLGLDEPEIHLHPYMQRSLIKYVSKLVNNTISEFSELIKDLFEIDEIFGQAIIATHSPNILNDEYKSMIRFYKNAEQIKIKSGCELSIPDHIEKHLLRNLPYIKEAFFSRCVILVEGDTEYGALPVWGEKYIKEGIDTLGISIIKADGGNGIPNASKLLLAFNICHAAIIDSDIYNDKFDDIENLVKTNYRDFEEELYEKLKASNKINALTDLIKDLDDKKLEVEIQKKKIEYIIDKYRIGIDKNTISDYKISDYTNGSDPDMLKALLLAWLDINKSVMLGRSIGELIEKELIPEKFCAILEIARKLSQDANN